MSFATPPAGLQKRPPQARAIATTAIIGPGAVLIAVALHLTIHAIYEHGIVAARRGSQLHFVIGSFLIVACTPAVAGWPRTRFRTDSAGRGIPQAKPTFWRDSAAIPRRVAWGHEE